MCGASATTQQHITVPADKKPQPLSFRAPRFLNWVWVGARGEHGDGMDYRWSFADGSGMQGRAEAGTATTAAAANAPP